jgi:UDP-N-acetylglucosamine 1-carboxyvinyltransferase
MKLLILCAVLLTQKRIINNIPDIIDINKLITLLENLEHSENGPGSYTFQADDLNLGYLETEAFKKEVGHYVVLMIVGHSRFGKVIFQKVVIK